MTTQEHHQILSEIAALKKMLAQLPESSVIERMSLEARKEALEEELASQRQAGAEEVPLGYKRTEAGVIPEDWEIRPLGDIASIRNQKILPSNVDPDTLCVELEHIGQGNGRLLEGSTARNSTSSKYRFFTGDVLFGRLRSYLRKYWHASRDGICTTEIWPLMVNEGRIDSRFLYATIQSDRFIEAASISYGTHMPRADWTVMKNFEVCLPPLPEQRAIAAALYDADGLIGALDALIEKKRAIKQAAMQQLLTGKKRLPGFSGEWEIEQLGNIADLHRQSVYPANFPETTFTHYSLPAFDDKQHPVIELGIAIKSSKFLIPQDAVLVSKLNPRIPRVWLPHNADINAVSSTEFLILTPKENISRSFLFMLCSSPVFYEKMELSATGTTGSHQRINPGDALKIQLQLPIDFKEQTAIAAVLSDMDAEIAALERRRGKVEQIKQGMMQQLLTGRIRLVEPPEAAA